MSFVSMKRVSFVSKPMKYTIGSKTKIPDCKSCKHFEDGLCKVFATQEPVSGSVIYLEADTARSREHNCGLYGLYYIDK